MLKRLTAGLFVGLLTLFAQVAAQDGRTAAELLLEQHRANLNYLELDGDTLAYLEYGPEDATTLILLHGIPTSSFLHRDVAPGVASAGYRVIVPDLLGFGESGKPQREGAYTVATHAERVFALADALGVDTFVLGLHDIGGLVGWEMLLQDADRLEGLVLADTTAGLEGVTPAPLTAAIMTGEATPRETWSQLDDPAFAADATRAFLVQGYSDERLLPDALVEVYTAPLVEGSSEAFTQFFEGLGLFAESEPVRREAFASFNKPVAIIFGAQDKFFDPDVIVPDFQRAFGVSPGYITVVEEAGHYIQEQAPAQYVGAVLDFLNESFPK